MAAKTKAPRSSSAQRSSTKPQAANAAAAHTTMRPQERRAVRIDEAAAILGVSRWTVQRRISDGALGYVRLGGTRLIPVAELDRMLHAGFRREKRQ